MQPKQNSTTDKHKKRHYIPEWAAKCEVSQADISRATGADKSLVSRWFNGMMPREAYLEQLAALFHTERDSLFRHPDEAWIAKFFNDRSEADRRKAIEMLELIFPKTGNSN